MTTKTTAQLIAEIATARQGMQDMIAAGMGTWIRERQERLINNLKAQLANRTA